MSTKTKNKKQEIPKWFQGDVYSTGGEVTNPFSRENYELNAIELSLYDFIIGSQMVFSQFEATRKQITDFDKALRWFRVNNPEAYMVLLD
jgi:hypothetical protein|tara:strand:+ start:122 stop:391 length:270 start_codon:yes stop_codon:yes gene_type:complete